MIDVEEWRSRWLPWLFGAELEPGEADAILAHVENQVAAGGRGEEVLVLCDLLAESRRPR